MPPISLLHTFSVAIIIENTEGIYRGSNWTLKKYFFCSEKNNWSYIFGFDHCSSIFVFFFAIAVPILFFSFFSREIWFSTMTKILKTFFYIHDENHKLVATNIAAFLHLKSRSKYKRKTHFCTGCLCRIQNIVWQLFLNTFECFEILKKNMYVELDVEPTVCTIDYWVQCILRKIKWFFGKKKSVLLGLQSKKSDYAKKSKFGNQHNIMVVFH